MFHQLLRRSKEPLQNLVPNTVPTMRGQVMHLLYTHRRIKNSVFHQPPRRSSRRMASLRSARNSSSLEHTPDMDFNANEALASRSCIVNAIYRAFTVFFSILQILSGNAW